MSSLFALLFLLLLMNSLMWKFVLNEETSQFAQGFIRLSLKDFFTGFLANCFAYPFLFLVVFLFKNSKSKILKSNHVVKALDEEEDKEKKKSNQRNENLLSSRKRFSLPFYCSYIGWALVFLFMLSSILLTLAQGITFGNDKLYRWLSSSILAWVISFFIFEPLKVVDDHDTENDQ